MSHIWGWGDMCVRSMGTVETAGQKIWDIKLFIKI